MIDHSEAPQVPGLPAVVLARIGSELGRRGDRVVDCLRTAAALIGQARDDDSGLRLAESAAYNIREALDAVVEGRPIPEGGVRGVVDAWTRYRIAAMAPDADVPSAWTEFEGTMERLEQDVQRQAFKTLKLLEYFRVQTGIEPLPGQGDPTAQYSRLRERANKTLHDDGTVSDVAALYDEAVGWFLRYFTPPDDRVRAVVALAERPYADGMVEELRELALTSHQLRLFFSRVVDPAWLDPLYQARLIQMPRDGEPWPFASLVARAGAIDPARIAEVLDRLLDDSKHEPERQRLGIAREILQNASRLGVAGHAVAKKIIAKHPGDAWVQTVAVAIVKETEPTDPIQLAIADAVVGNEHPRSRGYRTRTMLVRLTDGLTARNVVDRVAMMAAKIRRLAGGERTRFVVLDMAALHTNGEDLHEPILLLTHHLTTMIPRVRELGVSTNDLLGMVETIPGELGERITCQVLAGANDVDRDVKIGHIERRMASETATGDDRDLIADILTTPLSPEDLHRWHGVFGEPSPPPALLAGADAIGDNWTKAWRWSLVLPPDVLTSWQGAIAAVTALHGPPTAASLHTRMPRFVSVAGRSAHSMDELSALPVLDAAALVSDWRSSNSDDWGVSARALAGVLEAVVRENPRDWTESPSAVVTALRQPIYVDRYFRVITDSASDLADRAHAVIAAATLVRAERWEPVRIGPEDEEDEPDWSVVDPHSVELIAAFANQNSDLSADLDVCWSLASELVRQLPDELPGIEIYEDASVLNDPYHWALNRPCGKALGAVIALGGWEHRNHGAASPRLVEILDEVLSVPGAVGLELRSVLATHRVFLESVATEWLSARAGDLFGPTSLGALTFDQMLKRSRPTKWFYDRYHAELAAAARRGADNAGSWLLVAFVWGEAGYTFASIVGGLSGDVPALRAVAEEMPSLMQDINSGDPLLDRALQFWELLLDADRHVVPADVLVGSGRWTFVDAVDKERWFELMHRTLDLTGGDIDLAIDVADRCREAQPSSAGLRILRVLIGHGESWEQHDIETAGVEALRLAARHPVDEEFDLLRARLIERGRNEASDITPEP